MKYFVLFLTIIITITLWEHLIEFHARLMERIKKGEPLNYDNDGVPTWLIIGTPLLWILYLIL